MHQKEGNKMLKWLKQKPAGHHHRSSQGSNEVGQNKIITDDPLATIQVHHPQQKKSKNKSEEIYAVSRVNPLFEEEDVPKVVVSRGNQSGSSGYDSGPTSDDDDLKFPHRTRTDNSSTSSTSSFSHILNSRAPPNKHGQIFRDDDDPLVHHQAAILSHNGKPVLQIVEQNPDFVQSISVAVGGRPLSPIDESFPSGRQRRDNQDAISNRSTRVSIHPVPTRSSRDSNSNSEDSLGVAKLIQKENRFVQSIRIGSPKNKSPASRVIHSTTTPYPPSSSSSSSQISRKPSVTFSERVELVAAEQNVVNGKILLKGPTPYRKASAEQDSIVTESLLLMTSSRPVGQELSNATNAIINKGNNGVYNRLINPSKSDSCEESDGLPDVRKISTDSSNSDNNNKRDEFQRIEDLQAFSSSIRKNHPVKHILSNSGKSLEINPAADHYSSVEFLDDQHNHLHGDDDDNNANDCDHDLDGQGHNSLTSDETRSSSTEQETPNRDRCRRSRANCPKSPFGGIADLYSAAKEIAKEIESYSNGSAKTNSKKSIVRDLLSGRGRDALTVARKTAHEEYQNGLSSPLKHFNNNSNSNGSNKKSSEMSPRHSVHNDAIEAWESVRVQQVYLKGRTWKEIEPSSSSSEEGNVNAGQRVMSLIQQGQVHSNNKKERISNSGSGNSNNSNPSTTNLTTYASVLQQSSSNNKQQQLKSSIYDGLSSEGASSNNEGDDDASSDSGNSTDRNVKASSSRQDILSERRAGPSRSKGPPVKPPDPSSSIEEGETGNGEGLPPIDKVMIVTGDSQNMVVDLSGIPEDLREAIISGTALITLPDGLKASSSSKGGYTIVSIPSSPSQESERLEPKIKSAKRPPPDSESEIKAIPSASVNLHKLERGELYSHIFNSYGTKNKTQIWDVMQQSVQQTLIEGENGKKKRITTVLPLHPNQDAYKSPDFTMEGQRMEHQRKKMGFAKKRRCVCKVFGILFFLATFIGVLVALSMIYTKGQRYFGSA